MNKSFYAYYFPNWHVTPQNEVWHGKGWTEWRCVEYATPRFPGHVQPKKPLWGYCDEADPKVMEKKIDYARNNGLDGFIFDWYWYPEIGPYRIDCLDKGFLGAKNSDDFQFAIMWCNHTPIGAHPSLYYFRSIPYIDRSMTEESFYDLTEYCIRHYFKRKNYIKVNGKPYFCIFSLENFIKEVGAPRAKELIADFRDRARKAGVGELTIGAVVQLRNTAFKENVGVDMISVHAWCKSQEGNMTYDYNDYVDTSIAHMELQQENWNLPLCPSVMIGEDNSPRTVQSEIFDPKHGYPYTPIALNSTPENVKAATEKVVKKLKDGTFKGEFLVFESFNEWTEGSYLEPGEEYGYDMMTKIGEAIMER